MTAPRRRRFSRFGLAATAALTTMLVCWPIASWLKRTGKPRRLLDYGLHLVDDGGRPLGKVHGPMRLTLDPFTIYRPAPNQVTKAFTINARGGRGPAPTTQGSAVVVLGGSAAFGQELANDSECFTARMQESPPHVGVSNFAAPGYFSGQELALFTHHLRDLPADLVIAFNGWNDLFDVVQGPPRRPGVYGVSGQFFEIRDRLAEFHSAGNPPTVPPPVVDPEERFTRMRECYFGNMLDLHRLAAARGGRLLWTMQPELGSKANLTDRERAILASWERQYRYSAATFTARYAELRAQAQRFAAAHGIAWLALDDAPRWKGNDDELFADPVHPNGAGHRLIAEILHEAVARTMQRSTGGPSAN